MHNRRFDKPGIELKIVEVVAFLHLFAILCQKIEHVSEDQQEYMS